MILPVHLAVSVGCPCGIGPEITSSAVVTLLSRHPEVTVSVFGDASLSAMIKHPRSTVVAVSELPSRDRVAGAPTPASGAAQLGYIDHAIDAVLAKKADAIVTGPVSKSAISASGAAFVGHTEHLARRAGTPRVVMMFAGPSLRTSLVTTHLSVASLSQSIDAERVRFTIERTVESMARDFAIEAPRVAVTGLNPHAGEGGLFGHEEQLVINPAIESARAACPRAKISGPLPAEAAFRLARDGRFDAVVAMFHDQATIASKLLDFGDAVNVTLGLPFVRTSVDHGTAYDIAGRAMADDASMLAALSLAVTLVANRQR